MLQLANQMMGIDRCRMDEEVSSNYCKLLCGMFVSLSSAVQFVIFSCVHGAWPAVGAVWCVFVA